VKVDFFEEYPDLANLRKAELVGFDSTVYLAARSLPEFRSAAQRLHDVNPRLRPAFWPVLRKSYWVSPFSYPWELVALFEEILAYGKRILTRGGRRILTHLADTIRPLRTFAKTNAVGRTMAHRDAAVGVECSPQARRAKGGTEPRPRGAPVNDFVPPRYRDFG
jgi:hypothetical protein